MDNQHAKKSDTQHDAKRPAVPSSETPQTNGLDYQQRAVLAMQPIIGNAALQRMANNQIMRWTYEQVVERVPNAPSWAGDEAAVRNMQRQLRRLGLYTMGVDGDYGPGTDSGMVEAFGNDDFRTMDAQSALDRLTAAQPPTGDRRGTHDLRYGEMFRDGILDMTIGIGYDEALEADPESALNNFRGVLEARSFAEDQQLAEQLYTQAGRAMSPSIGDLYFVRENALTYNPPAGAPRQIHAVVRLVSNTDGTHGAEAAAAFREGMVQSDVSYYSGHGRYGTGPDFDRNFGSFVLHHIDDPTQTDPPILDYDVLERELQREGRPHGRSAWRQFLWRRERGLIDVDMTNAGNIRMNMRNIHAGEFGSNLINWALNEGHITAATGEGGDLATEAAAHPERRYRVVVFDGCRTRDYETALRSTPGFDRSTTHSITTTRTVFGNDDAATLATFLDSIIQQHSAERIVRDLDDAQATIRSEDHVSPRGTFSSSGTRYDPVNR